MKILLVRPKPPDTTIGLQHVMTVEPLELEVIAATVADQHSVQIVDMILEDIPLESFLEERAPDLLAVTGYITHMDVIKDYCRRAKQVRPAIVTVAGGVHIEKNPADADCPWLDYRVVRNGAVVFPELVAYAAGERDTPPSGVLRTGEQPGTLPAFDFTYPSPRRDLTRRYWDRYFYVFHTRVAAIKTSFGCPGVCNFCYCRELTDGRYVVRPMCEVLDELESIEQSEVFIVDDNFLASLRRLEEFLQGIRERGIDKHYLVFGRADCINRSPEVLAEFRDAGLRTVIVGLESFFDDELDSMQKGVTTAENEQALRTLRELGLDCYAAIILSPDWGSVEFDHLRRKVREYGIEFANFQPLTPLPGTKMVSDEDRLLVPRDAYSEWDLAHLVVRPSRMSVRDYYGEITGLYTSSVVHPRTLLRQLRRHPKDFVRVARGAFRVWRQYRTKMEEAVQYG
jgi:radical SAM superfamily enzyme YgiQ (UPF0313 family)